MKQPAVLLLTNDLVGLDELGGEFAKAGFRFMATYDTEEAIRRTALEKVELAVVSLDYLAARAAMEALRRRNPGLIFIVLSRSSGAASTIEMVEGLGGAVLRERSITHRELLDLVVGLLGTGPGKGTAETIHRT